MTVQPGDDPSQKAYPLKNIVDPCPNDVMCGRGGGTNNHVGNIRFRQLVNEHKLRYLAATKVEKPKVAREVVQLWRSQKPPGRFLTRSKADSASNSKDTFWHDVGDQKAREKASQCLRERTPDVIPFVQHLQLQQQLQKQEQLQKKLYEKQDVGAKSLVSEEMPLGVAPSLVPEDPIAAKGVYVDGQGQALDPRIQQLQRLHMLQQQQQILAMQNAAAAIHLEHPDNTTSQDQKQPPTPIDPAAAATALLDQHTAEDVMKYLKRQSAPAQADQDGDESIDPTGSAQAIAEALFGKETGGDAGEEGDDPRVSTLEEFLRVAKQQEEAGVDLDDRSALMEIMSKTSWVQSFKSIDSDMLSAHSLGKIGEGPSKKATAPAPAPAPQTSSRSLKMDKNRKVGSNMSMISELSDLDAAHMEAVSVGASSVSRAHQMKATKGVNSNISMLSELTDMTGDFTRMGIEEEDEEW